MGTFRRSFFRPLPLAICHSLIDVERMLSLFQPPLPRPHGLLGTLSSARIGPGALAAHRQILLVAQPPVGPDLDQTANIQGDIPAEISFDFVVTVDVVAQPRGLLLGQVTDPRVRTDTGGRECLPRPAQANSEDVGQRNLHPLIPRQIYTRDPSHPLTPITLAFVCASGSRK